VVALLAVPASFGVAARAYAKARPPFAATVVPRGLGRSVAHGRGRSMQR